MISTTKKFIFVHVPKTAGSSIESAFADFSDDKIQHLYNQGVLLRFKHASAQQLRRRVGNAVWSQYFTFSIVRNPWDIAVSMYFYMKDIQPHLERVNGAMARDRFKTMMEDSQHMEFGPWLEKNAHLLDLPQAGFLADNKGNILVEHIGKVENITNDFEYICKKIGVKSRLPHTNRTQHGHYQNYYTDSSRAVIAERCAQDIAQFGYVY